MTSHATVCESGRRRGKAYLPLAFAGASLVASCIPAPPGGRPRAARRTVPNSFGVPTSSGAVADSTNSARMDWHAFFGDPHLVGLIDIALHNNQELNISVQEMIIANAEVMSRRGEYIPTLGFQLGLGLDHVGRYTSQGQADEATGVPAHLPNFMFGFAAAWEVDIWGRLRNSADAAMYRYLATQEARNFVITRLVAEIASRYYELLSLDRQLAILRNSIALQQQALEMVRLQQQAARVTMLAVQRFEAQLQGFQSRQFEIEQRIVESENQLNFLLGRFPQHVERTTADILTLVPPVIHTGSPAQLLENRPDVRRAENALRGAALDVSAARAAFYPALRLDAMLGVQSFDITRLVTTPDSILYNIFAGVMAPLFNRSRITAEFFSANSRQWQAVVDFERTVLTAFVDVNTGLNLLRNLSQSYALKAQQVEHLAQAVETSTVLFNSARADYLEVLTARREYLEAQMDLIETKQRQLTATVALYQALGGGWRQPERRDGAGQNTNAGATR
jgi:NodT family efflux transporter outer membrane factor (OMF) lipoprotein